MLYTRSSFIKWLTDVKACEIEPLPQSRGICIKNGIMKAYIWTDKNNRIDYEEIFVVCNKLYIVGLPGDSDLERIE